MEPKVETLHIFWTIFIHRFPFPFKDSVYMNFEVEIKEYFPANSLKYC